jgi:hypothetical protein
LFWLPRSPELFRSGSRCSPAAQARQWNAVFAGEEAFATIGATGYRKGAIFGRTFLAHRIIWAISFDDWPSELDHIDGDRGNNRLCNLRAVTSSENNRNRSLPCTNTSGRIGVFWHARYNCWRAQIKVGGHQTNLGSFKHKHDAIASREAAERKHGFHPNHGRRA